MDATFLETLLSDYRRLLAKIDAHAAAVTATCGDQLRCGPGCDSCCRHLTVAAVEALALAAAVAELPSAQAEELRQAAATADAQACPLLADGLCRLYAVRPLICRTHGLPLLVEDQAGRRVDFCPRNFGGAESMPGSAVLDLERVNTLLSLLNRQALERCAAAGLELPERLSLAAALSLQL